MDRRVFLSAGILALSYPLSHASAEEDRNAAEYYRKAFLLLPELTEAEKELIESLPAAPLNAISIDLIKRSEPALREMTRGAALKDCDWGVDYFAKILDEDTMPVMKIRRLSRLACLRASYSFQKREGLTAIADLAAVVKMGRHIGRQGPWIATLYQFSIEHSAVDVAAAQLPQQNAKTVKALAACLEALPRGGTLRESTQGEKEFLLQYIRPKFQNKSSKEAFELLPKESYFTEEEVAATMKATHGDIKALLALIDDAARHDDELAKISVLPAAQFKPALSAFQKMHSQSNPFAVSIVPGLERMRHAADYRAVRFAMLHAAIAIVLCGTGQLKNSKDPFGDGPFQYRSFKGGFELQSKLKHKDGPPITLTVGLKQEG
jgi:hypothetical protein